MLENHYEEGSGGLLSMMYVIGGKEMRRDDDYLRELLLGFEGSDDWMHMSALTINASTDQMRRHFHVLMMVDAGCLMPLSADSSSFRITNAGHDFLALTRKNEAWEATKAAAKGVGGASLHLLYRAAEGYAMQKLKEVGVPLA